MDDRNTLVNDFLGVAGRIERLRDTDPVTTNLPDPKRLERWQALYADNAAVVLQNRQTLLNDPATVSTADLQKWLDYARETLTRTPPDEPASAQVLY